MRFPSYTLLTIQTIRAITTKVPISPYPNTVASPDSKLGFRIPTLSLHRQATRRMFHSARKPNDSWSEFRPRENTFDPKPRIVHLELVPQGIEHFSVGSYSHEALHYVVKVKIGGFAELIAPLVGRQPPNTDVWVLGGDARPSSDRKARFTGLAQLRVLNLLS